MIKRLKNIRCMIFHRPLFYGLPTAGRVLKFPMSCAFCDNEFEIVRPNTPQWSNPMKQDKTQPKTWEEWERLHPIT